MRLTSLNFKSVITTVLAFICFTSVYAQSHTTAGADTIRSTPDVMPKAPYDWSRYLAKNLRYPKVAREDGIQGKVYISFVVERDGSITNVVATQGGEIGGGIPEEAIRVVQSMPKWEPGMQDGVTVRCYFTVPLNFMLQTKESTVYMPDKVHSKPIPMFNIAAYLQKQMQYPGAAIKDNLEGVVYVICTINEKGILEQPVISHKEEANPKMKILEEEALRLVRSMPSWLPAKIRQAPVKCYTLIPVTFTLPRK
jgi:TonB family protein